MTSGDDVQRLDKVEESIGLLTSDVACLHDAIKQLLRELARDGKTIPAAIVLRLAGVRHVDAPPIEQVTRAQLEDVVDETTLTPEQRRKKKDRERKRRLRNGTSAPPALDPPAATDIRAKRAHSRPLFPVPPPPASSASSSSSSSSSDVGPALHSPDANPSGASSSASAPSAEMSADTRGNSAEMSADKAEMSVDMSAVSRPGDSKNPLGDSQTEALCSPSSAPSPSPSSPQLRHSGDAAPARDLRAGPAKLPTKDDAKQGPVWGVVDELAAACVPELGALPTWGPRPRSAHTGAWKGARNRAYSKAVEALYVAQQALPTATFSELRTVVVAAYKRHLRAEGDPDRFVQNGAAAKHIGAAIFARKRPAPAAPSSNGVPFKPAARVSLRPPPPDLS